MKFKLLVFLFLLTNAITAQDLSVGGFVNISRGTIEQKVLKPAIRSGLGLAVNYYMNDLVFNTGLSLKGVGGSEEITVTTQSNPDGIGKMDLVYSLKILGLPIGANYMIVKGSKLSLYAGAQFDLGFIVSASYKGDGQESRKLNRVNSLYLGISPRVGIEYDIMEDKFLFMNLGYAKQLNKWQKGLSIYEYNIQNIFAEFGFACRLGK